MCGPARFRLTSPWRPTATEPIALPCASGAAPASRNSALAASAVVALNSLSGRPLAFLMVIETITGLAVSFVSMHHGCTISSFLNLCECACPADATSSAAAASASVFRFITAPLERVRNAGEQAVTGLRLDAVHVVHDRNAERRKARECAARNTHSRREQQHVTAGVGVAHAGDRFEIVP